MHFEKILPKTLTRFVCLLLLVSPSLLLAGINPGPDFSMEVPAGGALAGEKPRVFITTDPFTFERPDEFDDLQTLIETMLFSDVLDIEGIAADRTQPVFRIIDAYARDLPNLRTYSQNYPPASYLKSVTKSSGDDGVNLLIQTAREQSDKPLYVLSWGIPDTLAEALKRAPDIAPKIRIIMIGDSNVAVPRGPRESFSYLYTQRHKLWWVLMDNSFSGVYVDSALMYGSLPVEESFSRFKFPEAYAKDHGSLGNLYYYGINWAGSSLAENGIPQFRSGDLPSLLFLLRGDINAPEKPHWGGRFEKVTYGHGPSYLAGGANFWVDVIDANERLWPNNVAFNPWEEIIAHDAQRAVFKYQMQFMPELAARYDRAKYPKGANPSPLDPLKYTNGSPIVSPPPPPAPPPVTNPNPVPNPEPAPSVNFSMFTTNGPYAWVVYHTDDTKQWASISCRNLLAQAGVNQVASDWATLSLKNDTSNWNTCDVLADRLDTVNTPLAVTFSVYANTDKPEGWVVYDADGSKQWVSPTCRNELVQAGANLVASTWGIIGPKPITTNWTSCGNLLWLIRGY